MTYKLELFLVLQKKKRLINIKSFKNYVFMVYLYWTSHFLHKINSFGTKIKKFRLDRTRVAKLNSN